MKNKEIEFQELVECVKPKCRVKNLPTASNCVKCKNQFPEDPRIEHLKELNKQMKDIGVEKSKLELE